MYTIYIHTLYKDFLRCIHSFNDILEHKFCILFSFPFLSTLLKVLSMMVVFSRGIKLFFSKHFSHQGSLISKVIGSSCIRTKIFSLPHYLFFNLIFTAVGGTLLTKRLVLVILLLIMGQKRSALVPVFAHNGLPSS